MKKPVESIPFKKYVKLNTILNNVSIHTKVDPTIIKSELRISRKAAIARHIYCYAARKLCSKDVSLSDIGGIINRDHSNVVYAIRKIREDIQTDYKSTIEVLKALGVVNTVYYEYKLTWEVPKLTSIIKHNINLTLNAISETTENYF